MARNADWALVSPPLSKRWALAFPFSGSPASKNTRRVFVKDFPFALVYRPDEDGIVIFALANHSRQPEYWHPRVQER